MRKVLLVFGILFFVGLVLAVPSLPHGFFGDVKYSDGAGVEGVVVAKIGGVEVGRVEIVDGVYDLVVEGFDGDEIYFYLEGNDEILGVFDFVEFEISEVDFVVGVSEGSDDGSSSGDSSGGSSFNKDSSDVVVDIDSGDSEVFNDVLVLNGNVEEEGVGEEADESFYSLVTGSVVGFVGSTGGMIVVGVFILVVLVGVFVIKICLRKVEN